MAHIVSGSVTYLRRVKTGEYEHKEAKVTVDYALEDNEDANTADHLIGVASALATGHVFGMLRAKSDATPPRSNGHDPAPVEAPPEPTPAVEPVAEAAPSDPAPATNLKAAKRRVKEASLVSVDPTPGPGIVTQPSGPVTEFVDDFTADAPTLSDAELLQALTRKNTQLKDGPRIKALIGEFVEAGQSAVKIPGVRRAEFIEKLNALA